MSHWTREYSNKKDQRNLTLPPTWESQKVPTDALRHESLENVHQSGSERKLADRIVQIIAASQEMVCISSFLFADRKIEDALSDASKRGVRPYLLLASEGRLEKEPKEDSEFDQKVFAEHKEMLNRLAGCVLIRSASHFHAKFVLADPFTRNPRGFLLTANLTKEALERNEELGVEFYASEVRTVAQLFRWALWEQSEHEVLEPGRLSSAKPIGKVTFSEPDNGVVCTTSESVSLREAMLQIINEARDKLMISSFGWDDDHPVVQRIYERISEGLNVTILARIRPKSMPTLIRFAQTGASVFGFPWLHAKAIVADNERGIITSANFQKHGLDSGFELGIMLDRIRAGELITHLEGWIQSAPWRLHAKPSLGQLSGKISVWNSDKLSEDEIKSSVILDLGEVTAKSADKLEADMPELPPVKGLPRMAHQLECKWRVNAPKLNRKAKEIFIKEDDKNKKKISYNPPVFKETDGRKVVAVNDPKQLIKAQRILERTGSSAIVVQEKAK
jgi:cardiolipin synthase A/B